MASCRARWWSRPTPPPASNSLGGVGRSRHFPRPVAARRPVLRQGRNGGVQADHADDVLLLSGETRDLGRLVLEVGTLAEAVTVTAEVTPVNTSTSSLQRSITGDQLTMIQVKGRDIFGMMKILPGVSDTTFSRDYAAWQSGRGLSINGGNLAEQEHDDRRRSRRRGRGRRHHAHHAEHRRDWRSDRHHQRLHGRERPPVERLDPHRHQVGDESDSGGRAGTTRGATNGTRTTTSARSRAPRSRSSR